MKKDLFTWIKDEGNKLDILGKAYLDKFDFIANDDMAQRLAEISWRLFEESGKDWDSIPWWAANIQDGWMPFYHPPKNGSLHYSLGFSMVSQEAHLRNLLEIAEGREKKELDFPLICDLDDYPHCEPKTTKKLSKKKK